MSSTTDRGNAGSVTGGLSGKSDNPASGSPPVAGFSMYDEFIATPASGVGDLAWPTHTIGAGPSYPVGVPTADTEFGVVGILTAAGNEDEGGSIAMDDAGSASLFRSPPNGSIYMVKIEPVDETRINIWSGFVEDNAIFPDAAGSNDFIGVRAKNEASAANWFGVVRNGTTESTQDLGVAADNTWRILGFEVDGTGKIQFFTIDASDAMHLVRTDVGDPVATTNKPDTELTPLALGVTAGVGGGAKQANIDFWSLGGRVAR